VQVHHLKVCSFFILAHYRRFVCAVMLWLYKEEECHLTNNIPSLVIKVMAVTFRMSTKSSLTLGMTTKLHLTYSALVSANDLSPAYF
jgi:hypothetical protein